MTEKLTPGQIEMRDEIISLQIPEVIATKIAEETDWEKILNAYLIATEFNEPFHIIIQNELAEIEKAKKYANKIIYYKFQVIKSELDEIAEKGFLNEDQRNLYKTVDYHLFRRN